MKTHLLGAALLCASSAAAAMQSTSELSVPPTAGAVRSLPPPSGPVTWPAEQREGAYIEASRIAHPRRIFPIEGLGLPPGSPQPTSAAAGGAGAPRSSALPLAPGTPAVVPSGGSGGRPLSEDLPDGYALTQPVMQEFEGMGPDDAYHPCPDLATGYDHVVTVHEQEFATYDRAGNELFRAGIHDYLGISTNYELYQPRVLFDPWNARWVMMYHKRREITEETSIVVVVTEDSAPFGLGGSWYYDLDASVSGPLGNAHAEAFNLGYSNTCLTLGGNLFYFGNGNFLYSQIWALDKAEVYNQLGLNPLRSSALVNEDGSLAFTPCPVEMQVSWGEGENIDGSWINARPSGGDELTHWKLRGAFDTNIVTRVDIGTNTYSYPPDVRQPDGKFLHVGGCTITSAVTTTDELGANGVELFTSLDTNLGGNVGLHLFKLDPVSNVNEWETTFGASGLHYFLSSVAADFSGSAVWVFARTGESSGNEPELRFVDYDQGVFSSSSSQLRDGEGTYDGFLWGYYYGAQVDWGDFAHNGGVPGRPSKLWLYGQYGKPDAWGTYIGATSVFSQGSLSSVTPTTTWNISGSVGGPFTPSNRTYTLTNDGEVGLVYEISTLPPWLDASPPLGQLFPGDGTVTFTVNSNADWLSPGVYSEDIVFEDVFNGGNSFSRQVEITVTGTGAAYCSGELGDGIPCPCGNDNDGSLPGAGCANGAFASGAMLVATGNASVSADTLVLTATNMQPSNSGLYFQGDNAINSGQGVAFGDGLRCAGDHVVRLQVRVSNSAGVSATTIGLAAKGGVSPGDVRRYQCWYRDTSGNQPCGAGVNDFNLTNGYRILWTP